MPDIPFNYTPQRYRSWLNPILLLLTGSFLFGIIWNFEHLMRYYRQWTYKPPPPTVLQEGQIAVWVAARRIPPYTRIEPAMIRWDPKSPEAIKGRDIIMEPGSIVFRVALTEIEPGFPFREEMLAPRGTQPGLAAGIPPGWAAVTLNEDELDGQLYHLRTGNMVALMSVARKNASWISRQAKVLLPLTKRQESGEPTAQSGPDIFGRTKGGKATDKFVKELTLAVPGSDLVALTRAKQNGTLQVVLLSGVRDGAELDPSVFEIGEDSNENEPVEKILGDRLVAPNTQEKSGIGADRLLPRR